MDSKKKYTPEEIKEIGRRIRELRLQTRINNKKISQNKLGELIETSKHVVYRLEAGILETVDTQRIRSIAHYLDCSEDYLLLNTDRPEHPAAFSNKNFRELPEFQKRIEGFIYSNNLFRDDIEYMLNYMHPDYQEKLLQMFHTYITFHKLGIHYPNISHEEARKFKPENVQTQFDENFWAKLAKEQTEKEKKEARWPHSKPDNSNKPYWSNPELT